MRDAQREALFKERILERADCREHGYSDHILAMRLLRESAYRRHRNGAPSLAEIEAAGRGSEPDPNEWDWLSVIIQRATDES